MRTCYFITLFPEVINSYINASIIKQAQKKHLIAFEVVDLRKYATNNYKQVDDYQYGGSAGMVIMLAPVVAALEALNYQNKHVIMLSPRGQTWTQTEASNLAQLDQDIIFLCGHYEGFDERVNFYVNQYCSVGDYVLTSGELASLVIVDSFVRLIPGVINQASLMSESFQNYLLDYPVYTKPAVFNNRAVPEVLLSGHHEKIAQWRHAQRVALTKKHRPDLYAQYLKTLNKQ